MMVGTRMRGTGWLAAVSMLLALSGCRDSGGNVTTSDGAPAIEGPNSYGLMIASVDPPIGNTVVIRTAPTVTEDGPGECRGTVRSEVGKGGEDEVVVTLTVSTSAQVPYEGCTLEPRSVTITLSDLYPGLRISDGSGGTFSYVDGRFEGCPGGRQICNPDPASCDDLTLHDAIANADVPAHFDMPLNRCEPPFAVVDVDYGSGACGPTGEEGSNPCAGQRLHRMYWQIVNEAWVLIGYDDTAGCDGVLKLESDFPRSLCDDLPPVAEPG